MDNEYERIAQEYADSHIKMPIATKEIADNESTDISETAKGIAMAEIVSDPKKAIGTKLSGVVATKIDTDQKVADKVSKTADSIISNSLEEQANKADASNIRSTDDKNEALYEKYKNEYKYHGLDHKVDKVWKTQLMSVMNDIWFVIFAIISFFTIVPISIFMERIGVLHGIVKWAYGAIGILLVLGLLFAIIVLILHLCGINFL